MALPKKTKKTTCNNISSGSGSFKFFFEMPAFWNQLGYLSLYRGETLQRDGFNKHGEELYNQLLK